MREIKFRIWDELKKTMWQPENIATFDFESKCALIKQKYKSSHWIYFNNSKRLRYTGLKDKYGVEIYEGDIVVVHEDEGFTWKDKVEFFNGCFMVDENVLGAIHTFTEVIGNIYENPELLEGGDEE